MEDEYGMADLSRYINGRPIFQPMPPAVPDLLSGHLSLTPPQNYPELGLVGRQVTQTFPDGGLHQEFRPDSATACGVPSGCFGGLDMETGGVVGDGGSGRWPRQETLTLLEIRSRLDSKFKEAIQKGPLWDEISRIMWEEHGYQRTGKKCREKFENLYKYYKKTKDGKAGRQDGKSYRFFRQLEALYGDSRSSASFSGTPLFGTSFRCDTATAGNNLMGTLASDHETLQHSKLSNSVSLSNCTSFYSLSSENSDLNTIVGNDSCEKAKKSRKSKKNWKAKVKHFIDSEMRNLMEKQDDWLEKMTRMIEEREQERILREEEWRKQEEDRIYREQKLWATEKTKIQARDAYLMEVMRNLSGKEPHPCRSSPDLIIGDDLPTMSQDVKFVSSLHVTQTSDATTTRARDSISTYPNHEGINEGDCSWLEREITSLIQLRISTEERLQELGCPEEVLWEEIAAKMACLGYDRNAAICKDKWESMGSYFMKGSIKKRKEDPRACCYTTNEFMNSEMGGEIYSCSAINTLGAATGRHAQSDHDCFSLLDHHKSGRAPGDECHRYAWRS